MVKYVHQPHSIEENCSSCKRFSRCKSKRKGWNFKCQLYDAIPEEAPKKKLKKKRGLKAFKRQVFNQVEELKARPLDKGSKDFLKYIKTLAKTDGVILDDPRVDDRDFKPAPNFYEWCVGKDYLNTEPFAKQLQLGIMLNSEYCPRCSDTDYVQDIPFEDRPEDILERVELLRWGKCPRCKSTKGEMISSGELPLYRDLVAVVGQRSGKCISGKEWVLTPEGYKRFYRLVNNKYSTIVGETGKWFPVTERWVKKPKPTVVLTTEAGHSLVLTREHPIMTSEGYIEASKTKKYAVPLHVGQNSYPSESLALKRLIEEKVIPEKDTLKFLEEKLPDWIMDPFSPMYNNRKHVEDTEFKEWVMALPKSILTMLLRDMFFKGFTHGDALLWQSFFPKVRRQVLFLLSNLGVFARISKNRVIIEGRACLVLARQCDALTIPQVWNSQNVFRGSEGWYDYYPHPVRKKIYGYLKDVLDELKVNIPDLPNSKHVFLREMISNFNDKIKGVANLNRTELLSILSNLKPMEFYLTKKGKGSLQDVRTFLDPKIGWTLIRSVTAGKKEQVYDIEVADINRFLCNGLVVHNSVSLGHNISYSKHKYLMLRNPSKYFELPPTILHGNVVATTFGQAKESVWDPLMELVGDSPWFQNYHEFLKDKGNELGEELFTIKDTFSFYRHRGLSMGPSSPSKRNLRGRTRFFGAVDELGWFGNDEGAVKINGLEIYKALARSLQTLRSRCRTLLKKGVYDFPPPFMYSISSPSDINDPIMTLYRKAERNKTIYAVNHPTWEFNPTITKEDLAEEFDSDNAAAWRDFGARPPLSTLPFIAKYSELKTCFNRNITNAASVKQKIVTLSQSNKKMTSGELTWHWNDNEIGKLLTIDPGSVDNSFAFAVSHIDPYLGKVFDMFGEIIPSGKYPVSYPQVVKNILMEIVEKMGVKLIASDRWQNIMILQTIEEEFGIPFIEVRAKYRDFIDWRDSLHEGKLSIPIPELKRSEILEVNNSTYPKAFLGKPISHLVYQCLTVQDIPGKTVDKGSDTTDDLFRCMIIAHSLLNDPEIASLLTGPVKGKGNYGLGAFRGLSSGGSSSSGSSGNLPVVVGKFSGGASGSTSNSSSSVGVLGGRK